MMRPDLWSAGILGVAAGLSPGPLLVLVTLESLTKGFNAAIRVAVTPLLTDGPIALLSIWALNRLPNSGIILGTISCIGAAYLIWLAIECTRNSSHILSAIGSKVLKRSVVANLLNPAPYLFWISVGGPLIHGTSDFLTTMEFIALFYLGLIGSKIGLARVVSYYGAASTFHWYSRLNWGIASIFVVFAVVLFYDALSLFYFPQ
jgi:threonine/homoserine/homoserine lactone efflux protein